MDDAPRTKSAAVPARARGPAPTGRPARISGVWELAWPSMTSFGLQAVVGFVDMLFVSSLGSEVTAGVGIGSQLHFLAFALMAVVTTGTVAMVARFTGAGDGDQADRVLRASLLLSAAAGLLLMLALPFTRPLLGLFGVVEAVVAVGSSYLAILLLASVPLGVEITFDSAIRGAGDVRTPLFVGVLVNLVNVAGDYALIFGHWGAPALGADGSAWASGLAFLVGAVVYTILWRSDLLVLRRGPWLRGIDIDLCRRLVRIGIPSALEQAAFNVGIFAFMGLVGRFGTDAVSAYIIGVRILAFSFIPGNGFAAAGATLVGQHLGAGDPLRASRAGWRGVAGAAGVMTSIGLLIIAFAGEIASWFGAAGEETTRLTVRFIYILGAAQPLMAFEFALGGALRGAGDTRFPLFALLAGLFVFRLGGAGVALYAFDASVVGLWSCLLMDYFVKAVLLSLRFLRGGWKHIEV